jgi:hypothetical protein
MSDLTGTFLKVATLKKWERFLKFQDIDSSDFVAVGIPRSAEQAHMPLYGWVTTESNFKEAGVVHFISHRWESPDHPDPDGTQLAQIKAEFSDDALIWLDYSCLPQEPRTAIEDEAFREAIDSIPTLIEKTWFTVVGRNIQSYGQRAWCQFEVVCAINCGSLPPKNSARSNEQTEWCRQSPLYKALKDCFLELPKDVAAKDALENSLYLGGYFLDVSDLNDSAFSRFKSTFFQLQASKLADPPVLWELLRRLFPARREDCTWVNY